MTAPGAAAWDPPRDRGRVSEITAVIGSGEGVWERASSDVLRWAVKTRSGFDVPAVPVEPGQRLVVVAHAGPIRIPEPVEVVDLVRTADRVGFSYRTLPGHPVAGEETFIVHRQGDAVLLTIRSLTRPAESGAWRLAYPVLLLIQRLVRIRYLRALR